MRIRIDFADIPETVATNTKVLLADSLIDYLQNEYFQGADNAVKYIRTDIDSEYIELELMPG